MNKKKIIVYEFNKSISILHIDDIWYICNPLQNKQWIIDNPKILLNFLQLSNQQFNEKDFVEYGKIFGYDSKESLIVFEYLKKIDVLNSINSKSKLNTLKDEFPELNEVFNYLVLSKSIKYADYSKIETLEMDKHLMLKYLGEELPPAPFKNYDNKKNILLPHPAIINFDTKLSTLSSLLFWNFGKLRDATFHDVLHVLLKPVPSKGARHPFEFYLSITGFDFLDDGFYHYNVKDHSLSYLFENPSESNSKNITIFITIIFERVQWRYRSSWAYKDVFFDLGHVISSLKETSKDMGIKIKFVEPTMCTLEWFPLFEECVAAIQVNLDEK